MNLWLTSQLKDFEADSEDISIFDNNSVYSVVDRIGQLRVT